LRERVVRDCPILQYYKLMNRPTAE